MIAFAVEYGVTEMKTISETDTDFLKSTAISKAQSSKKRKPT